MAKTVLISSCFHAAAAFLKLGEQRAGERLSSQGPCALVPTCLSGEELSASFPQRPWPISRLLLRPPMELQWDRLAPTLHILSG